jgi:hypothetical protein
MALPTDIPRSLVCALPDAAVALPEPERTERLVVGNDSCKLDGRRFFLRGNIELRVIGAGATFVWTVWTEVEHAQYKRALALWTRPTRIEEPAYPALCANYLPTYPSTLGLPGELRTRLVGQRFEFRLSAGDHPLIAEQEHGVQVARLREILAMVDGRAGDQ